MRVFGLGYDGFHDSNVCAANEHGEILWAAAEERFSGAKKDGRFPRHAIEAAGAHAGGVLCVSNVDEPEWRVSYARAGLVPDAALVAERQRVLSHIDSLKAEFKQTHFFNHHDCHAASAFFSSGFRRALVVTWDAGNDSEPWNLTVQIGRGSQLRRIEESLDGSPALDYAAVTALYGFKPGYHEGKITGLAAAGAASGGEITRLAQVLESKRGQCRSFFGRLCRWHDVGSATDLPWIEVNQALVDETVDELGFSRETAASAIQRLVESRVVKTIRSLQTKYPGETDICLAGGLFANILLNRKIKDLGFQRIHIHPAMGDDGLAFGACALYLSRVLGRSPRPLADAFLGPQYSEREMRVALERLGLPYQRPADIERAVAARLANGSIVARYAGRMEYGPRALGNRSILCSAGDRAVNSLLNDKLRRSEFMPFAPITLERAASRRYDGLEGTLQAAKFMTIACPGRPLLKKESPAVVHLDGTARPQLVGPENPLLKKILEEYARLTGLPTLVNTSFNLHENPIVLTPADAVRAFLQSRLDYLAIGPYLAQL